MVAGPGYLAKSVLAFSLRVQLAFPLACLGIYALLEYLLYQGRKAGHEAAGPRADSVLTTNCFRCHVNHC